MKLCQTRDDRTQIGLTHSVRPVDLHFDSKVYRFVQMAKNSNSRFRKQQIFLLRLPNLDISESNFVNEISHLLFSESGVAVIIVNR